MRILPSLFLVGGHSTGLSDQHDCNIYVVRGPDGLVMIDAGGGRDPDAIVAEMRQEGLDPEQVRWLLLTHHHADHASGAAAIKELTGCKVAISHQSAHLLERGTELDTRLDLAKRMGVYPDDFIWHNCPVDEQLHDGKIMRAAGIDVHVIEVEGHSLDSCCFHMRVDGRHCLFVGDVLQYGGLIGLINFPGSTLDGYRNALPKLRNLNVDGFFPGHSLFTVRDGQRHIDKALERLKSPFVPPTIGQQMWF